MQGYSSAVSLALAITLCWNTLLLPAAAAVDLDAILEASDARQQSLFSSEPVPPASSLRPNQETATLTPNLPKSTISVPLAPTKTTTFKQDYRPLTLRRDVQDSMPLPTEEPEADIENDFPEAPLNNEETTNTTVEETPIPLLQEEEASDDSPQVDPAEETSSFDVNKYQNYVLKNLNPISPAAPVQPVVSQTSFKTDYLQPEGPEGSLKLSLADVINLSLQNNLSMLIAKVQSKQSLAEKREAIAEFLPNGLLSYRQSRFQGGVQVFDGEPVEAFISTILPQAELNLPINLGGSQIFNYQSQHHKYLAKTFAESAISQDSLLKVCELYTQLLNKYIELSLIEKAKEEAQTQLAISEARFDEGLGILLEVLEAKNLVQANQRSEVNVQQDIQELNYKLATELGLESGTVIVPQLDSVVSLELYREEQELPPLLEAAIQYEPSVELAKEQVKQQKKAYQKAIAEAFPTLNLRTYINLIGKEYDNLLTTRFAGVELTSRLFDGLGVKQYQKIKRAKLEYEESQLKLELANRELKEKVGTAYATFVANQQRLGFAKERLATSEKAREQAQGRYEAGIGNYLEVLSAAKSLQDTRNQYLKELLGYKLSQLTLARRVGSLKDRLLALVDNAPAQQKIAKN